MIIKFRHTGIIVSDINKSTNFYSKILGLKINERLDEQGEYFNSLTDLKKQKAKVSKIILPDKTVIELIQFIPRSKKKQIKHKFNKIKQMHICFTVKNIDNYYKNLKKKKIKFVSKPLKSDFDPVKTCFFYDPDFNLVQIVEDLND